MNPIEQKKEVRLNRSQRRAAGMRGKFTGRNGRSGWTGKKKVKRDD